MRNKALKGDYGYIKHQRTKNLRNALICIIGVITAYFMSVYLELKTTYYLTILSALLILPSALFLTKFILYSKYKPGSETFYKRLSTISKQLLVICDLIVVRGKKTVYFEFVVLTDKEIIVLSKNLQEKAIINTKNLLDEILKSRGYNGIKVSVYTQEDKMYQYINNKALISHHIDENRQGLIAETLILNTV